MNEHATRLAAREAADRSAVTGRLAALLTCAPAGYTNWSYQQVAAYKDAMKKAQTLMDKPKAAIRSLRDAESVLKTFHSLK